MSEITFTPCYPRIMKKSLLAESPYFGQKRRINRNITDDGACTIIQMSGKSLHVPFIKQSRSHSARDILTSSLQFDGMAN